MSRRAALVFATLLFAPAAAAGGASVDWIEPSESSRLRARLSAPGGVAVEDAGGAWTVRLGGRLAVDHVQYDERNSRAPGPRLDEALLRLDLETRAGVSARLVLDLVGLDARHGLAEGWLSYSPLPEFRLTAGLIPIALGVEHAIPEERLPFVGYSFPAYLADRTDVGVRIDGEIADGIFSYDLAAALGEGFDAGGERRDEPMVSGKGNFYPFRWVDFAVGPDWWEVPLLRGLFFNIAYAYLPDWRSDVDVQHPLRGKLFFTPRFRGDAANFLAIGYGADFGPVRAMHEFVSGSVDAARGPLGGDDLDRELHAWQATGSVMLTGEPYDSRPYRRRERRRDFPRAPLDEGGAGAWEIAVRYSNGDIARELIDLGLAPDPGVSQEFRTFTAALNWHPTAYARVTLQVVRTLADQDPFLFGGRGRDTSGVLRFELDL